VAAVKEDKMVMVAPVIRRIDGHVWFSGSDLYLDDGRMGNPRRRIEQRNRPFREWITGACFALSANLWQTVGGFDADYFLYWEDVDLSFRVVEAGGRLIVDHDAEAIHDAGGTQSAERGARGKSEIYYYYNIRNRLVYAAKNLEGKQLAGWLRATPGASYEILRRGGRAQFLRPLPLVRALVRGIRDGRKFVAKHGRPG
jgi:N-acetylglucosaminyl-diphospho-decaprenol L-rhamnosyltransferase